ncbi:hypothetical protein [Bacillus rhizoplanae]|uniref:hypothetical protein n=1 Tax=Bacillus rhizoplanae TaxID=2880966 RepID=UPI003D21A32E
MKKRRIIAFFTCIVIVAFGIVIAVFNKMNNENDLDCRANAVQIKAVAVDYKNQPVSNVKVYENSIANQERTITNSQGEFQFYSGVCGKITLLFVTPDGNTYTKKYDREDVPNIVKLE